MLKWIVIWLVGSFIIAFSLAVIQQLSKDKKVSSDGDYTIISFDRFLKFYDIAPDTWYLGNDHVTKTGTRGNIRGMEMKQFTFAGKDMTKYKRWRRHTLTEKKYNSDMEWLVNEVKKDLEKYENKNKRDLDERIEELVNERMKAKERFLKMRTEAIHEEALQGDNH